jgi:hypothetical protein
MVLLVKAVSYPRSANRVRFRQVSEDGPLARTAGEISISRMPRGPAVRLLTLAVMRFFLISRCTPSAHAALQLIENTELSLQSIMGAQLNFQLFSITYASLPVQSWEDTATYLY